MSNFVPKPFNDLSKIALKKAETVVCWGKTLIVAPHPDDESLGCGGAIALLRKHNLEVGVLTMSDGTLSHPNSKKFPPEKLRDIRESEMIAALEILGVSSDKVKFLRLGDRRVPGENATDFTAAVETIKDFLAADQPETIVVPWRRDPHPDHRATWQIFSAANDLFDVKFRILEYPIWLWEMAETKDLPRENEIEIWRLDVSETIEKKQRAIHAHLSQTTDLIDDDPNGFRLSPEVLAHFAAPFEIYLEEIK
ncbi:MAG: PIG-L family deacetylase [Pyrinomonadaceae bacterium]|nr:PIG-L family deacetylase [Pyrinomonadaceae bacterium]